MGFEDFEMLPSSSGLKLDTKACTSEKVSIDPMVPWRNQAPQLRYVALEPSFPEHVPRRWSEPSACHNFAQLQMAEAEVRRLAFFRPAQHRGLCESLRY